MALEGRLLPVQDHDTPKCCEVPKPQVSGLQSRRAAVPLLKQVLAQGLRGLEDMGGLGGLGVQGDLDFFDLRGLRFRLGSIF